MLQTELFRELVNVRYKKAQSMPLFRTIQWTWFALAMIYICKSRERERERERVIIVLHQTLSCRPSLIVTIWCVLHVYILRWGKFSQVLFRTQADDTLDTHHSVHRGHRVRALLCPSHDHGAHFQARHDPLPVGPIDVDHRDGRHL